MPIFTPTRRDLLRVAAAMPALSLPAVARGQTRCPAPNPGFFRFTLGDMALTVVSDGHLELDAGGLGVNADPEEVQAFLARHYLSTEIHYSHTNHLVIESGDRVVLVDIGSGDRFLPTAGQLLANLEAAGIDPYAITDVIITHAHPDHIWGVRDGFDEVVLPDAQWHIGRQEHDFWMQENLVHEVPAEMQQFVLGAQNSINVDGGEWALFEEGDEIAPGIRIIATPGHTPGHVSVVLESQGKQFIALGDSMNHAWTNFAHPGWYNNFDWDGEQTVATRKRLLDMAAADGMAVLGYHFPFPGVGHVMAEGEAYRFVPALWRWE